MKSAKRMANDMADAVNIDSHLIRGFAQGFINVPVDFYYLGYDYIDTENRWLNSQDKERFIRLVKSGLASKTSIETVAHVFLENKVRPFEDAVAVWERDRKKFNQICQYFFTKVNA
ncbi:hypothetical protein [Serratia ficaria]|uniref:hypothetical protein n=1 Tax=Serratia ficaria TaxID=61651 RepID=UPI0021836101|nr:hypothetical protein [Serratia ficaria]CAI2403875.1 Uncharacterised protein [Serratia ficaria]